MVMFDGARTRVFYYPADRTWFGLLPHRAWIYSSRDIRM